MPETPYNPLERENLAANVARTMLSRKAVALPPEERFQGAGIYALYYAGDFPLYGPIAEANRREWELPIYVGKAVPKGRRKGLEPGLGPRLFNRLREHAESIRLGDGLDLKDFRCRWLVVDDIWVPLAEAYLIREHQPIWNTVVEGFGIHNPGGNRPQRMSAWDTLHPGRTDKWKVKLKAGKLTKAEIEGAVRQALKGKMGQSKKKKGRRKKG